MLKKLLISSVFILSIGSLSAAELKIGIIDMQTILSKASQVQAMNEKVQKQFKERYDALAALQKKGIDLQKKAKRDEMTLTTTQRLELKRQLQALDGEFKMKQTFLQEDISIVSKQEQVKVMRKIQQAIEKIAVDDKFDFILKAEALVYASPTINISDKVIAIINNPAG